MDCEAYASGRCRSCTLLEVPYGDQVRGKQRRLEELLRPAVARSGVDVAWQQPLVGRESGFRAKAKMVVAGTVDEPTVGILDAEGRGVDLRDCPLYVPALSEAFPVLAEFVTRARLAPYDVPTRSGELKHLLVTAAPSGDLMVRFVMRSTEAHARLLKHLPWLQERLPSLTVASLNVLPEHKAVLEGEREIALTPTQTLAMAFGEVTLHLRPQSFFQTHLEVARALYRQVGEWVAACEPSTVWDLYCGVGGFALHALAPGREVTGVEVSQQAVASAAASAADAVARAVPGAEHAHFEVADATEWAQSREAPDVVIVNPPRRGIGPRLAEWIERSGVQTVVYSSCNAVTLARDLEFMPSLRPVRGRLLDMFPHTEHFEAVVLLERQAAAA